MQEAEPGSFPKKAEEDGAGLFVQLSTGRSLAHCSAPFTVGIHSDTSDTSLCVLHAQTAGGCAGTSALVGVTHSSRAAELMLHLHEDISHPRPQV